MIKNVELRHWIISWNPLIVLNTIFVQIPLELGCSFSLFCLWFIKLVASPSWSIFLFSVLLQQQVLHVRHWEHTDLMAGWQSHFIMCALNTRDSTMWNTETPHPCTKPGWIILMLLDVATKDILWPVAVRLQDLASYMLECCKLSNVFQKCDWMLGNWAHSWYFII